MTIPALLPKFVWRYDFAAVCGPYGPMLMSYGPNIPDAYEKVAEYAGHILDGAAPADLPVSLPDRFEFVINLNVAHADRVKIPASLMTRAEFVRARLRSGSGPVASD